MSDTRPTEEQDAVIRLLSDPASYSPPPGKVDRIDTHGAIVLLAGDRVYKIKRAVRLPYFDFSTLEKRRAACEREVEINRLTAPGLYLGTIPITRRSGGGLSFGGDGFAKVATLQGIGSGDLVKVIIDDGAGAVSGDIAV